MDTGEVLLEVNQLFPEDAEERLEGRNHSPIEVFFPELPGHMKWVRGIGRVTRAVSEDHLTGLGIQLKAWHFA